MDFWTISFSLSHPACSVKWVLEGGRRRGMVHKWTNVSASLPLSPFPLFGPCSSISGVSWQHWHLSSQSGEKRSGKIKSFGFIVPHFAPQVCRAWERGRAELLSVSRGGWDCCCCLSTPHLPCWLALLVGNCLSLELIKCRSELHSLGWTDSSRSSVLQIGIEDFICVFSEKGKLTSWLNLKEWSGWQSLYMGWGLIWL